MRFFRSKSKVDVVLTEQASTLALPSPFSERPSFSTASSFQSRTTSSSGITTRRTSFSSQVEEPVIINALSLDGGGVRGVSSAYVAKVFLDDLAAKLGEPQNAYDHFQMMGGTSTGGLIAIIIGRLQVSLDVVVDTYKVLSTTLFKTSFKLLRSILSGSKYSGTKAEKTFQGVVAQYDKAGPHALLRSNSNCNVFVTSVNVDDTTGEPIILRSYDHEQSHTVAEAAQATTAAPTYFPSKKLSSGETVVDGGVRFNNPTELLYQEARRVYGRGVKFGLLLSIGTGQKSAIVMRRCKSAMGLMHLPHTMGHIMTDSEAVHQRMQERFEETDVGTYVRINVPEIGDLNLDDYKSIPIILKATEKYMNTPDMLAIRKEVVQILAKTMKK